MLRLLSHFATSSTSTDNLTHIYVFLFQLYLLYLQGPVVDNGDKLAAIVSTLSFASGLCFIIHSKNVKAHKFCMIVGSAALFTIPVQRLYWFLVMKVMIRSVDVFKGNLMNYFIGVDATFILAVLTVFTLGYIYAKDNYADVKFKKKMDGKKVA